MTLPLTILALVLLAFPSLAGATADPAPAAETEELTWWTTHALEKVLPDARPPAGGAAGREPVDVSAARNEFEPFQLVLRAGRLPVRRVDATLTDLAAEEGSGRIEGRHGTLYLQRFLRIDTPSSAEAEAGEWPDPLVPRVDPYAGERRNAFPFDLEPGRSQPLWIELYVPTGTAPGVYRGEVRIAVDGAPRGAVPVRLRVWPFTLPSTSSLPNSFGFSGISALEQHYGSYTSDDDLFALTRVYAEAALRHRLSIHGGSMAPPVTRFEGPPEDRAIEVDWLRYDREVAPFLGGTVFGEGDPLPGARATSVDLRTPPELPDEERVLYWRAWAEHFRERGWLDRLFVYVMDEPEGREAYRRVLHLARLARRADPELRTLLTEQRVQELAGWIDVWVSLVNCLDGRPGYEAPCEETVPRAAYRAAARAEAGGAGEGDREAELWWYQSCASHGCNRVGGREAEGWPSYVVDAPAVAARVFPWLAWGHEIGGELYYNTVEAYGPDADPWRSVYAHGGNGDGTLFYPGTPQAIGGRSHVPVESLRLKLIREGLEDYEYLALAAKSRGVGWRPDAARELAPRAWHWERSPEAFYAAREALARRIVFDARGEERS